VHDDPPSLTSAQLARVEFACRDLAEARTADLAALPASALIMEIERLRARLDDMLTLINEVHGVEHGSPLPSQAHHQPSQAHHQG
jgi:hypothetical protein